MSLLTFEQSVRIVEKLIMHPHYCNGYYQITNRNKYVSLQEFIKTKAKYLSDTFDSEELYYFLYSYAKLTPKIEKIISEFVEKKDFDEDLYDSNFLSMEFIACKSKYFYEDFTLFVLNEIDPEINVKPDYEKYSEINAGDMTIYD